jgi:hypothetical protein
MSFKSQREAARHFITAYCEDQEIEVSGDMKEKLSKEDQASIATMMAIAAVEGDIPVKSDRYSTQDEYEKYFKGQINDTLRKDKTLNGGDTYVPKNPGKFKNAKDPQIKALTTLLKTQPDHAEEIQQHIDARQAELDAAKAPQLTEDDVETLKELGLDHLVD